MVSDNNCVQYARDCVRLAQTADDPQLREQLLQMAREWMAVAMKETKARDRKAAGARTGKEQSRVLEPS